MKETGMRDCADWVFVLAFFLLGVILALAGIHMFNTRINRKTEACAHVVMAVVEDSHRNRALLDMAADVLG